MGRKNDPGEIWTPKQIANKIKSKGIGKQHLYCQMCRKQCRDQNGFNNHLQTSQHMRNMRMFEENQDYYLDKYSGEFEHGFCLILKNRYTNKLVSADSVYSEYQKQRSQTRLNGTRWETFDDFIIYLGDEGICEITESPEGSGHWFLKYKEDEEATKMRERLENAEKMDDEERHLLDLQERAKKAKEREEEIEKQKQEQLNINNNNNNNIDSINSIENQIDVSEKLKEVKMTLQPIFKMSKQTNLKLNDDEQNGTTTTTTNTSKRKQEEMNTNNNNNHEQESKKQKRNVNGWLLNGIIVKIVNKSKFPNNYGSKGVIISTNEECTEAQVEISDSKTPLKITQSDVETVIPALGKNVRIVRGEFRGQTCVLKSLDQSKFSVVVEISETKSISLPYEDVSKI